MSYVTEGNFGCIFNGVNLSKETEIVKLKATKSVLKILPNLEEWESESKKAELMAKLDPTQKFFIYPISKSLVEMKSFPKDIEKNKCSLLKNTNVKKVGVFRIPHAGIDLQDYVMKNNVSVKEFITIMKPVIDAVKYLIKKKYVHQDLKMNNIMIDPFTKQARIIDFGYIMPFKDIYNADKNITHLSSLFWLHPPEYLIYKQYYENPSLKTVDNSELNNWLNKFYRTCDKKLFKKDKLTVMSMIHTVIPEEEFKKRFFNAFKSKPEFEKYANKSDIYSLGLCLLHSSQFLDFSKSSPIEIQHYKKSIAIMIDPDYRSRNMANF